jgi:hypothetical protein
MGGKRPHAGVPNLRGANYRPDFPPTRGAPLGGGRNRTSKPVNAWGQEYSGVAGKVEYLDSKTKEGRNPWVEI